MQWYKIGFIMRLPDIRQPKSSCRSRPYKTLGMGLTTWKYAPDGRILKSDVSIAKNYLSEKRDTIA